MIKLTKMSGEEFRVNPDTIKFVEDCGDTILTLVTGERLMVRERVEEVSDAFLRYKKEVGGSPTFVPREDYAYADS